MRREEDVHDFQAHRRKAFKVNMAPQLYMTMYREQFVSPGRVKREQLRPTSAHRRNNPQPRPVSSTVTWTAQAYKNNVNVLIVLM